MPPPAMNLVLHNGKIGEFTVEAVELNATDCPLKVSRGSECRIYGVESDAWNLVNHVVFHCKGSGAAMEYQRPEAILKLIFDAYPSEFELDSRGLLTLTAASLFDRRAAAHAKLVKFIDALDLSDSDKESIKRGEWSGLAPD